MTTAKIAVRPMRSDDAEDVRALDRLILGDDRSATWDAYVKRFLDVADYGALPHPPLGCFVARQGGELQGFLLAELQSGGYGLPTGMWIVAVGVHPDARRHGIGRMLVDGLEKQCKERGIERIFSVLRPVDDRDRKFLESCGLAESRVKLLGKTVT